MRTPRSLLIGLGCAALALSALQGLTGMEDLVFYAGPSVDALKEIPLKAGESFHITTGTVHRMVAVTDVDILEASTPDLDDVVRLEDRYGRA